MRHADSSRDALNQRYADLLSAEREDPALTDMVRDLDAFMAAPPPADAQRRIGGELLARATARYQGLNQHPARAVIESHPGARRLVKLANEPVWMGSRARRLVMSAAMALLALVVFSGGAAFAITHLDPGLRFQLGVPAATGPTYTNLNVTHAVGDSTVTLAKAAFTSKKVIIGFTYDQPAGDIAVCPVSLTSREGDTFRAIVVDTLPEGVKGGVAHSSVVVYFSVVHLQGSQQERHMRLMLQPCDSSRTGDEVAFDFTVPLQQ